MGADDKIILTPETIFQLKNNSIPVNLALKKSKAKYLQNNALLFLKVNIV